MTRFPFYLFHAGWTHLAIFLQTLLCHLDPQPIRLRVREYFRQGARLRARRWEGEQDYPVYVINRTKDVERMSRFEASCRKWGINYARVEGIDLRQSREILQNYRERIAITCYNKTEFVRGIYGCFLGHREAWETLAAEISQGNPNLAICTDLPDKFEKFTA